MATALFDYRWPTSGSGLETKLQALGRAAHPGMFRLFDFIGEEAVQAITALLDPARLLQRLDEQDDLFDIAIEFQGLLGMNVEFVHK